ncbi:MAG: hypothetical protein ACK559_03670 [bacterium]
MRGGRKVREKGRGKWERKIDRKGVINEGSEECEEKVSGKWERKTDRKGVNNEGDRKGGKRLG